MNQRLSSIILSLALCMSAAGAQLVIDVGEAANDRTGNGLRTSFTKVNTNFTELYAQLAGLQLGSGFQPLDADLSAIAALTGTNTIYYRSAANTWTAVSIGSGL